MGSASCHGQCLKSATAAAPVVPGWIEDGLLGSVGELRILQPSGGRGRIAAEPSLAGLRQGLDAGGFVGDGFGPDDGGLGVFAGEAAGEAADGGVFGWGRGQGGEVFAGGGRVAAGPFAQG